MAAQTPDFYTYPNDGLASAELDGHFVRLAWSDGAALTAYDLWLFENSLGAGIDPATREGMIDPADLPSGVNRPPLIAGATIDSDGALVVAWNEPGTAGGHRSTYHPGWLRHVATGQHRADAWLPRPQAWTVAQLGEPPTHDASDFPANDSVLNGWVNDLVRYGIARLRNLPVALDTCLAVAEAIGAPRETNFGRTWDVKADVSLAGSADTNSTANTNLRLGPHTDLPTREIPPGFQFLFCYANEAEGGYSTMADGLAVVAELEAEHPDHYEALTTLNWIFFNRGPGIDHRWSGPFIDQGRPSNPLTLRAFYPVRAFPDMDPADQPRAYEAMTVFSRLAASDRFQMRYPFQPGDLVGFDNRRILHGRDAFTAGGYRHLRGAYIDHDEVFSFARATNRAADVSINAIAT